MRDCKTIELDPDRRVTVHELRVRDVRRILAAISADHLARPLPELLREHLPDLLHLLDESLTLPDGETLDDLSVSECRAIGEAWWALHKDFFLRAVGLAGMLPTAPGATSTEPS